jgi:hypothetical protein
MGRRIHFGASSARKTALHIEIGTLTRMAIALEYSVPERKDALPYLPAASSHSYPVKKRGPNALIEGIACHRSAHPMARTNVRRINDVVVIAPTYIESNHP